MEAGEENAGSSHLKRQRTPLSDSEDNLFLSEPNDGQKRRRLDGAGQENRSPKPSSSQRLAELEMKPDTPIVASVRSRLVQLTQRREGAPLALRCLSDPGTGSLSPHEKDFRGHLLGEGEFSQRLERFKVPVLDAQSPGPTASPSRSCPRPCSNFVSGIQQKLQGTTTPSSMQASRLRQERQQELKLLQPISENAWLKRSNSDSSLNQAGSDAEMIDGSFTEALPSGADEQPSHGGRDSESPAASLECVNSDKGLKMEGKEQTAEQGVDLVEETDHQHTSAGQTVLKLSFSEEQSFSGGAVSEDQDESELAADCERNLLESTRPAESNMKAADGLAEHDRSGVFSSEGVGENDGKSYSEDELEPSTDEDLRLWRYPHDKVAREAEASVKEEFEISTMDKEDGDSVAAGSNTATAGSFDMQGNEEPKPGEDAIESPLSGDQGNVESNEGSDEEAVTGDVSVSAMKPEQKDTEGCTDEDEVRQQSHQVLEVEVKDTDLESGPGSTVTKLEPLPVSEHSELEMNVEDAAKQEMEARAEWSVTDGAQGEQADEMSGVVAEPTEEAGSAQGKQSSRKVTFKMEPEFITDSSLSETSTPKEASVSDAELSSHDETNTAEMIDQMFEEVLEYAERIEEEQLSGEDAADHDSGISACTRDKDSVDTESEKGKSEEEEEAKEDGSHESNKLQSSGEELLTFPPSGILSPLSKSVEAVVTPLRLTVSEESNPPSLLLTPEEIFTPPAESAPLYSIDAYRTQRQSKQPKIQSVTPVVQRRAAPKAQPQPSVNTKEKIAAHNEEAAKLQTVINQTLHALSCCTDEVHGRGSLEEAEAEKLLLVSCEKRSALLAEVARLREQRGSESEEAAAECVSQQPCRGTVSITNIQLPLKVEFVCSAHNRAGRPSHYFFILIRYGPCNIIATPLATAADAQNGDTISFPTSVTLKDIRSSFEIDVEVYSLSHTSSNNCSMERTAKSRVTPRKLLNTITRSSNSLTAAPPPRALSTRRSSNFSLVGSHKITLASLGHSKFPLDKMKLEGKIRRLLGDEFQEKVPFLSPLEGNIYLQLHSEGHSSVQHQGFLTMFELLSGYGVWHRRFFVLEGCNMYYWNHPNDREAKEAEGSISLSGSSSRSVRPVKRDSCARPFTFELINNAAQQQQDNSQEGSNKCWFSADTKQERLDWIEKLNQALLDYHTWNGSSAAQTESQQSDSSSGGNLRESIL